MSKDDKTPKQLKIASALKPKMIIKDGRTLRRCCTCSTYLDLVFFGGLVNSKDGLNYRCRPCERKRNNGRYHSDIEKNRALKRLDHHLHRDKRLAQQKRWREGIRMKALTAYGGTPPKCNCCQENTIEFLSIDHVNGGGNKERKEGKGGGHFLYIRLQKMFYPSGFQVLCFNCNMAKGIFKICPHTKKQV